MLTFLLILIILIILINFYSSYERNPKNVISLTLNNQGVEDVEECMLWAFGEGFGIAPLHTLDERWNELHSDLFIINGCDNFLESFKRIGKAYKEMKNEH